MFTGGSERDGALRSRGRRVPRNRAGEAFPEICRCAEAEGAARARDVERSPRLAVGLRGIEHDPSVEADELGDQLREVPDADLESSAEVDRLRRVVPLGRVHDAARAVLDVEELARRVAGAPAFDGGRAP